MLLKRFLAPLATAAVVLVPALALAQPGVRPLPSATERYRATADRQSSYYESRRTAYDQGFREGVKEGDKDARRGERFTYQDEREFQRADRGYHRSYGDRERYRRTFREGYAAGYSDSFDRIARYGDNGRYGNDGRYGRGPSVRGPSPQQGGYGVPGYGGRRGPNGGGYYTPAFDNGLRDGQEKGQEDARKNRSHDVLRHSWYRAGDRDYEGRYGSRDEYKNVYRQGFQQGYERGFREGRYR